MARQEQDSMTQPGMPPGSHAQFAPNMSPQGSRAGGPSPNPNDMARGTPKMQPGTSPNGQMQGRGSPAPGGFDPNSVPPNMRAQMVMGPNGQMLPRSHPQAQFPGNQLTQGQLEMFNRQSGQMMPSGTFPGGPQQMPPGMMPGQPGPGQQPGQMPPNMTPRQGNQAMPPPPAPQPNQTGGTQPSSPAASAAPPTPSQANKPKPGKKNDAKNNKVRSLPILNDSPAWLMLTNRRVRTRKAISQVLLQHQSPNSHRRLRLPRRLRRCIRTPSRRTASQAACRTVEHHSNRHQASSHSKAPGRTCNSSHRWT